MRTYTPEELADMHGSDILRADRMHWRRCVILIEKEGISRAHVAKACRVSLSTVNEWFGQGKVPPLVRWGHILDSLPSALAARVASRLLASRQVVVSESGAHTGQSVTQCALGVGSSVGLLQGAVHEAIDQSSPGGSSITSEEALAIEDAIAQLDAAARQLRAAVGTETLRVVG